MSGLPQSKHPDRNEDGMFRACAAAANMSTSLAGGRYMSAVPPIAPELVQRHQPPLASPYSIIKGHGARVTAPLSTAAADFVSAEPTGDERLGSGSRRTSGMAG